MSRFLWTTCYVLVAVALGGCNRRDERLADFAQQAAHEQAAQNERVAEANRLVAESQAHLIEADAQSRTELIALQQDLRADQAEIGQLRDELEVERREIVDERRTDSATGAGLVTLAIMMACLSPLLLAAASLLGLFAEPKDGEISIVLAEELTRADVPRLPAPDQERLAGPTADETARLRE